MDFRKLSLLAPEAALKALREAAGAAEGGLSRRALETMLSWAVEDPLSALVVMGALKADPQVRAGTDPVVRGLLRDACRIFRERALCARNPLKAAAWARAAALTGEPLDGELRARARPWLARAFVARCLGRTRQAAWFAARDAGRAADLEAALAPFEAAQIAGWLLEARLRGLDPWQAAPEEVAGPLRAAALSAAGALGLDPGRAAAELLRGALGARAVKAVPAA